MLLVGAQTPESVPTVLTISMAAFCGSTTVSSTGTITNSVSLPGPGSGSLLVTHRLAL
jgi:hypothetical protein